MGNSFSARVRRRVRDALVARTREAADRNLLQLTGYVDAALDEEAHDRIAQAAVTLLSGAELVWQGDPAGSDPAGSEPSGGAQDELRMTMVVATEWEVREDARAALNAPVRVMPNARAHAFATEVMARAFRELRKPARVGRMSNYAFARWLVDAAALLAVDAAVAEAGALEVHDGDEVTDRARQLAQGMLRVAAAQSDPVAKG